MKKGIICIFILFVFTCIETFATETHMGSGTSLSSNGSNYKWLDWSFHNLKYNNDESAPDLLFGYVDFSGAPLTNENYVQIGYEIANRGEAASLSTTVDFYLSADITLDEQDIHIYHKNIYPLEKNKTRIYNDLIIVPNATDLQSGLYYLIAVIDHDSLLMESNRTNNYFITQIIFNYIKPPDIENHNLALNNIAFTKDTLHNDSYMNPCFNIYSHLRSYNLNMSVYLSPDTILSADDLLQENIQINSLTAGNTEYCEFVQFALNDTSLFEYGYYYVIAEITSGSQIVESDTTDNICFTRVYFDRPKGPELSIVYCKSSQDSVLNNQSFSVNYKVLNSGGMHVEDLSVDFYLSIDQQLDNSDVWLNGKNIYGLLPGEYYDNKISLMPKEIQAGEYFLICIVDKDSLIAGESNREDNYQVWPLMVFDIELINKYDIELTHVIAPDTIIEGMYAPIVLEYIYINQTESFLDIGCFLSSDSIFDEDDFKHLLFSEPTLSKPFKNKQTFYIVPFGPFEQEQYYLILKADVNNQKMEDNEDNNLLIIPVVTKNRNGVDIGISGLTMDQRVLNPNGRAQGSLYISSWGPVQTDTIIVSASISTPGDTVYQNLYIGCDTIQFSENPDHPLNFSIEIPDTVATGFYTMEISISPVGDLADCDTRNNYKNILIAIQENKTDYILQNGQLLNEQFREDGRIDLEFSVINNGYGISNSPEIIYVLSSDTLFSSDDRILGSYIPHGLGIQYPFIIEQKVNLPGDLDPGNYHLLVILDPHNLNRESNRLNNHLFFPVTFESSDENLVVSEWVPETSIAKIGNQVKIDFTFTNTGSKISSYHTSGFYLSKDTIVDKDDIRFGYISLYLEAGGSYSNTVTLHPHFSLDTGRYYIICFADDNYMAVEASESDNKQWSEIYISYPDIDLEIEKPDENNLMKITPGNKLNLSLRVINHGTDHLNDNLEISFFLSADTILSKIDDTQIKKDIIYNASIKPGVNDIPGYIFIHEGFRPGDYYIHMVIDSDNKYLESNEINNQRYFPVKIMHHLEDLTIHNVNLSSDTLITGKQFGYTYQVLNNGECPTFRETKANLYFSSDSTISPDDSFLKSDIIPALEEGVSHEVSGSVSLPYSIPAGNHYLILQVDPEQIIQEVNRQNNIYAFPVEIVPKEIDQVVQNVYFTVGYIVYSENFQITTDDNLGIHIRVRNEGSENIAPASYAGYYLSRDTIPDASDLKLGTKYIGSIAAGQYRETTFFWNVEDLPTGYYYILIVADDTKEITEINEDNNCFATRVIIYNNRTGIDYTFLEFNQELSIDSSYVSFSVTNAGNADVVEYTNCYIYLSTNPYVDPDDLLIKTIEIPPLESGEIFETVYPVERPAYSDTYVLVLLDGDSILAEVDEENNFEYVFLPQVPFDLSLQSQVISEQTVIGTEIEVESIVDYQGSYWKKPVSIVHYLSNDEQIDDSDRILDSTVVMLQEMTPTIYNSSFIIPEDLQQGNYSLIIIINSDSIMSESQSENNIAILDLQLSPLDYSSSGIDHLRVYPNPASQFLLIESEEILKTYTIISARGTHVMNGRLSTNRAGIDVQELGPGVYFLNIHGQKTRHIIKFEVIR